MLENQVIDAIGADRFSVITALNDLEAGGLIFSIYMTSRIDAKTQHAKQGVPRYGLTAAGWSAVDLAGQLPR